MVWSKLFLLSPLLLTGVTANPVPVHIQGEWKIGKPYYDMFPQPIGLNANQEKKLIGQVMMIGSTLITACGIRIPLNSVQQAMYSADAFLQKYGITPDQIGLRSPVIENSFEYSSSRRLCGSAEGLVVFMEGEDTVLETCNDYFHLSRIRQR